MRGWFVLAVLAGGSWLLGCAAEEPCEGADCRRARRGPGAEAASDASAAALTCSDTAKERIGLGGTSLTRGREDGVAGADRRRTKSYAVLSSELARVLGSVPPSMDRLGATFGEAPPRWYSEAKPSAVALSSALDVAFEGCLKFTGSDAAYAAAPEISTATAACTTMARKFWSRVVDAADVQGCVDVATVDASNETYATGADGAPMTQPTPPRRRWAYACAALLTTTRFLTY